MIVSHKTSENLLETRGQLEGEVCTGKEGGHDCCANMFFSSTSYSEKNR